MAALKIILIFFLVLVMIRILLPQVILFIVNRKIDRNKHYSGRVGKVRIQLFKCAFTFQDVVFDKRDLVTKTLSPFFVAQRITITLQWIALLHKTIIGEVLLEKPTLKILTRKSEDATGNSFHLKKVLQRMIPFRLNIQCKDGKVEYTDESPDPKIDVIVTDLQIQMVNISNIKVFADELPAEVKAQARVYEGALSFNMKLNPLMDRLTFDMNMELKSINLVLLNDFLRTHAHIDVNEGMLSMYTEVAAKEGGFKGYIKPIITNLDVVGVEDRGDKLWNRLWEGFVAVVYQVIKNKKENQVATKITIEGKWDDPRINILSGISSILKNTFIHALQPSIDDVIDMASVRGKVSESKKFLRNLFGKKTGGGVKKEDHPQTI